MRTSPLNSRRSATRSPNISHLYAKWEKDTMSFNSVIWWIRLNLLIKVPTIHYHCRKQRGRDDRLSMFIKPCEIQRDTQNKSLQPLQESAGHLYWQPNCELHSWLLKTQQKAMTYKDSIEKDWIFMSYDWYSTARSISKGLCSTVCKTVFQISAGGRNARAPTHKPKQ